MSARLLFAVISASSFVACAVAPAMLVAWAWSAPAGRAEKPSVTDATDSTNAMPIVTRAARVSA